MREVRLALGYTDRTAFSTKVGIERSAYIKLESGPSKPSMESLQKIKAVFKQFNLNYILDPSEPILLGEPAPAHRGGLTVQKGGLDPYVQQLLLRIDEQAKTIERLWDQNTGLLGKSPASAFAAAMYATTATAPIGPRFDSDGPKMEVSYRRAA